MILLNPGPVNVSERVRQALLRPDVCHRESEFTELLHGIQAKLLKLFVSGAESEYAAVVLTGSGTAAVESAIMSSLPHGKRCEVAPTATAFPNCGTARRPSGFWTYSRNRLARLTKQLA